MKKALFLVSVSAFLSFDISCSKSDNTGQERGMLVVVCAILMI